MIIKHTIKMVKSASRFRMYDFHLYFGTEKIAECINLQSAKHIQHLREKKVIVHDKR